ncbi:transposase [Kibdelosporangium aridum]|uniref:transposase n=1 Tax=Kibdelosporangium aridum TaxID=2030 RepID=UPI0021ADDB5A|nr:transposase [Kibdelosporangium aridum]
MRISGGWFPRPHAKHHRVVGQFAGVGGHCGRCGGLVERRGQAVRGSYCEGCGLILDRDLNAARNLAALVEASSPSCGATTNEPDGNPRKTIACGAAGTATGGPDPHGPGQRRHRKVTAA